MLGWVLGSVTALYAGGGVVGYLTSELKGGAYPSPEEATTEIEEIAAARPDLCTLDEIGRSTEGRPLHALRLAGGDQATRAGRPRLLVTAQIHAVEFVGSYVARAVTRKLVQGYGRSPHITSLLDRAEIFVVPLLNPDGAARIWRDRGWCRLKYARFTAGGVDPNRNFPFVPVDGRAGWNSGRDRPGSAYYRGPKPLSEPECAALAELCRRQRFCAAVNFHSFSGVVFIPVTRGPDAGKAARALGVFRDVFQSHQRRLRYRPVPERSAAIVGQLDPFLLDAFGTVSVTVEVSRPSLEILSPRKLFHMFSWCNPSAPERWVENDADATIHALVALLDRTGGTPCTPVHPQLADWVGGTEE